MKINNHEVDSVKTGHIVIADFLPWSDLDKSMFMRIFTKLSSSLVMSS